MIVSKSDFIEFLIGIAKKDEKHLRTMENAIRRKTRIWGSFEWVYVKDCEMCIKALFREHMAGNFPAFEDIKYLLTCDTNELHGIPDAWILERIMDCRSHLENLDFQEEIDDVDG